MASASTTRPTNAATPMNHSTWKQGVTQERVRAQQVRRCKGHGEDHHQTDLVSQVAEVFLENVQGLIHVYAAFARSRAIVTKMARNGIGFADILRTSPNSRRISSGVRSASKWVS